MKSSRLPLVVSLLIAMLISACGAEMPTQPPTAYSPHLETTPQSSLPPAVSTPAGSLSLDALATLKSLRQVDDYPLYTMYYTGEYPTGGRVVQPRVDNAPDVPLPFLPPDLSTPSAWGCSLFAALGEGSDRLYGRNFDWEFSPALLLFTDPPDGYASVSMVDIAYLGFSGSDAQGLTELPPEQLYSLLESPSWPFDGMNSQGLAIGMAAVSAGNMRPNADKPTIDSLMIIREVLDHAVNVEQAVGIFERYNIEMGGGPPLHYLMADATGAAVLVEFFQGEMHLIPNDQPYHLATNFLLSAVASAGGQCWRYDALQAVLAQKLGALSSVEAVQLLSTVSQDVTQWSIVYDMTSLEIHVVTGRQYDQVHIFELK